MEGWAVECVLGPGHQIEAIEALSYVNNHQIEIRD